MHRNNAQVRHSKQKPELRRVLSVLHFVLYKKDHLAKEDAKYGDLEKADINSAKAILRGQENEITKMKEAVMTQEEPRCTSLAWRCAIYFKITCLSLGSRYHFKKSE